MDYQPFHRRWSEPAPFALGETRSCSINVLFQMFLSRAREVSESSVVETTAHTDSAFSPKRVGGRWVGAVTALKNELLVPVELDYSKL